MRAHVTPVGMGTSRRVRKTELPNGLRVLSEEMPTAESVAIGVWVENGSRYETSAENGLSHFIEHLLFKGTARRTAKAISEEIDGVGGVINADTGRESTCYYVKVLGEHAPLAIDLIADIFLDSRFDAEDVSRERDVVCEEIAEIEDTPEDLIDDLFHHAYWPRHALGLPVCGTRTTVEQFDRDACLRLMAARYRPNRIVVAAAGCMTHDALLEEIVPRFGPLEGGAALADGDTPAVTSGVTIVERPLEQVQLYLGTPGVAIADPERDVAAVLNAALGGGPSSRLFQEVRERRGLAYAIDSSRCCYRDTGFLSVGAGTRSRFVTQVLDIVLGELRRIRREGLTAAELERTKGKLKGAMRLGLETTDDRMDRLALNEIYLGRDVTPDERAIAIDAVTNERIVALAERLFIPDGCALVLLGPVGKRVPDARIFDALA